MSKTRLLTKDSLKRTDARVAFDRMIGSSAEMKSVLATVEKVAVTDVPVLISGESGTGKELLANSIHSSSSRRSGPFVTLNCGAIPDGLLESELFGNEKGAFTGAVANRRGRIEFAEGGTLFMDEVGDLAPALQVKLLRFLQEKTVERVGGREEFQVDCRVIAATHRDLSAAVVENRFREDLYFRIAVVTIELPSLRDRGDDVIELADHIMESFSRELRRPAKKLTRDAIHALRRHRWPGNVRELQNRIKRALVLADGPSVGAEDLDLHRESDAQGGAATTLREAREKIEREMVGKKLLDTNGNVSKAAKALGISRPTLYGLMNRYGLH